MLAFWKKLVSKCEDGQKVFIVFVAANAAHSPGTTGAKLLVSEDGETLGTIGGGTMEHNLIARARDVLRCGEFEPEVQTLHHRKAGSGEKSGMICAGSQSNLYYLCQPKNDLHIVKKAVEIIEADKTGVLRISHTGMVIQENELHLDMPQFQLEQTGEASWRYEEQLLNFKRIAIIGGGHCALALSRVMKQLGYEVFVYETRASLKTFQENIFARKTTQVADYSNAGALVRYPELAFVLVMTPDYPSDVRGLLGAIAQPFPFIGVMGSQAKIAQIFKVLQDAGVPDEKLDRLYAPVGLPINSHTPEEIAISIAAQIIKERGKFEFQNRSRSSGS